VGQTKAASAEPREVERRRTILRAAIDVFAEKGYQGCRIADVAKQAGVAYGLVYHYFKNKDELLQSVFEASWGGFVERVREAFSGEATMAEKVRRVLDLSFEAYRIDPRGVRVLILEIGRSPAGEQVNRTGAFFGVIEVGAKMFEEARAKGELKESLDPRLCSMLLFGAIEMGLTNFLMGLTDAGPEAIDRVKTQLSETLLEGMIGKGPETTWKRAKSSTGLKAARRS
jgi:TetR/AcrR family fatty acid metabolism transcriptional regulator